MSRRSGITLTEVIVVVAIVAGLAALSTPAYVSAIRAGQEASSSARLRQFHQALTLYRQDNEAGATYGPPAAMGLPLADSVFRDKLGFDVNFWQSPCGDLGDPPLLMNYTYMPGNGGPHWDEPVVRYQDDMVLMFDENCNPKGTKRNYLYQIRKGLGVMVGGQLKVRRKTGAMDAGSWWADEP